MDTETITARETPNWEIVSQVLSEASKKALSVVPELDVVAFITTWKGPLATARGLPEIILTQRDQITLEQVANLSMTTIKLLKQEIEFLEKRLRDAESNLTNTARGSDASTGSQPEPPG